ncbi:protein draper isoform X2 [Nematostella vectensis]|nr:protein draper isoform X2 [Nematostella vectensis]
MWTNQCDYAHGFVRFGSAYPNEPKVARRDDQLGQNLAREYGKMADPESRVERWHREVNYYSYGKYPGYCQPGRICGHYTQLVWALSRYLGCGMKWCNKRFGEPPHHPSVPGNTLVNCDYAISGNTYGQFPYKTGRPCSKCISGKGWCYNNLCRDCKDFSPACGTSLTSDLCTIYKDRMAKICPKMCNLCECPLECTNGGILNTDTCSCTCAPKWRPPDCSELCEDKPSRSQCQQFLKENMKCNLPYMQENCPATCGICDDGTGAVPTQGTQGPTTVAPRTESTPAPVIGCVDYDARCATWAAEGECDSNASWMSRECCESCKKWKDGEGKDIDKEQCPLWAARGDCDRNKSWMLINCRISCNQCRDCKDQMLSCPERALTGECKAKPSPILSQCRQSCGLCRVYDKDSKCPAWAVKGDCVTNWAWMYNNCPRSCDLTLAAYQYCATRPDGRYPAQPSTRGFIVCSKGMTKHVDCPQGQTFDSNLLICD